MKGLKLSKLLFTFLQCVILHFNDSFLSRKDQKEVIPSPKLHNFFIPFLFGCFFIHTTIPINISICKMNQKVIPETECDLSD